MMTRKVQKKIRLVKSAFYNEKDTKKKLADFILRSDILSMNNETSKFEKAFAKKQERKYAVFVNSGSTANYVLFQALLNLGRLQKGDAVGISAVTWSTNVMPLIQLGFKIIPIDCELSTLNVSASTLEARVGGIKALFLTNVLGLCDDLRKIKMLCDKNKVVFFEDNCESLGSRMGGKLLGNFGVASTFSFFVGHHFSTIEGGMIVTDDEDLYHALVVARAHGWSRNLAPAKKQALRDEYKVDEFFDLYTFFDLAFNVRPTDIHGFIGNVQMKYWDRIVRERERNFLFMVKYINDNDDFLPIKTDHMEIVSNFAVPLVCKDKDTYLRYRKKFQDGGVEIRPIIAGNISRQPFFKKYIVEVPSCPNADFIHEHGFYFGNNPELSKQELSLLKRLLQNG